jgi:hypothetical protein
VHHGHGAGSIPFVQRFDLGVDDRKDRVGGIIGFAGKLVAPDEQKYGCGQKKGSKEGRHVVEMLIFFTLKHCRGALSGQKLVVFSFFPPFLKI